MNNMIKIPTDLVTSYQQTRAGFISFALEKNRRSTPIIENAKSLKVLASKADNAKDLLKIVEIRPALLTASGLSDKALIYFDERDKEESIKKLIKNFLEPAGKNFVDELVYRYLLIKGDSLGGSMRNIAGAMAQQKLIRTFLSNLNIMNISYSWLDNTTKKWISQSKNHSGIEGQIKAIYWKYKSHKRILAFNLTIPVVKNNIDICLFNADTTTYQSGKIVNEATKIIMLGELKGGIDPAGADEHWKTANTTLSRIRKSFSANNIDVKTSFVGAAIENNMAIEIFKQLQNSTLSFAANLTSDEQLINYCDWLIKL